ncbi:VC0807 family protein [Kribbella sp. NPDC051586]|uniref:VC0807 family protein n=1 Tax=Kribbella sp. NPDC051586 TaxID=3364118 RepID=UPI003791F3CE
MRKLLIGLLWDIGLPAVVYYGAHAAGYDVQTSLIAAGVAALLRVAFVAAVHRRLDAIAAVVGGTFALLLTISLLTNDPRILLAKESVLSGAAGLLLVGSCVLGRPLVFTLARKVTKAPDWDDRWRTDPSFRKHFTLMTALFGTVLLIDAIVRLVLVYSLPLDTMANLSPVLHVGALGLLAACAFWLRGRRRNLPESTHAR